MQLLRISCPASQLALLFFLLHLSALCTAITLPHDVHTVAFTKLVRHEEHPIQPSTQPFSTQPIAKALSTTNTTSPTPPLYIFHLLDLRSIVASPETEHKVFRAMERTCEVFAYCLLDLDLLDQQDLVLRLGDFTLDFHDMAEHLSILAVKAVVMKLMQMIIKGLFGFVQGEMVDAHAGVRMIFAFGVLGVDYENRALRKRRAGEKGMTPSSNG
ncbi:hypothetical protein HO173_009487 [Letharia columbiana]|uniref:Uncharacterized protein n=1 Tax=Letharia columbiana TaxID=112416 RepID=A0A8H6L1U4_9LECA|nr:uncharacterized protein HO173_009487 [Letharia columbiana]KAF6232382.1 hypothetical protein HO173_009487 [Letharia columbiana]